MCADAFSYGDVPSFMRHKPTCIRNDAAIIISTNASLFNAEDYESLFNCFYWEERRYSFADVLVLVDVERRPKSIIM